MSRSCRRPLEMTTIVLWNRSTVTLRHTAGHYQCREKDLRPGLPQAKCTVCNTTTDVHGSHCSMRGKPRHSPISMSPLELLAIQLG